MRWRVQLGINSTSDVCKFCQNWQSPIWQNLQTSRVLGPLLFNLCINDLPSCLQTTNASMYADDTNLSCKGQSSADIEYKLNCDLDNFQKWLISNKLTLNLKKTDFMIIRSKQRLDKILETPKILYGEHQIKRVREKTVLGLIIDDQLKWNRHSNDEQCKKYPKALRKLKTLLHKKN